MLLSANISELAILSEEKVSVIRDAIEEMVHDFENKACVVFKEREELKEMLLITISFIILSESKVTTI